MASDVQVVNFALTLLGQSRIASLADSVKPAREANAIYTLVRNAVLANYDWSFAKTRAQLSALVDAPAFGYALQYELPTDCVRLVELADLYIGVDLTDYRGFNTAEFEIEGRKILTDIAAPLNIRYIKRIEDAGLFADQFVTVLGAKLAWHLAEVLTGSNKKKEDAGMAFKMELSAAIRSNAISLPPRKLGDDEWVLSRL